MYIVNNWESRFHAIQAEGRPIAELSGWVLTGPQQGCLHKGLQHFELLELPFIKTVLAAGGVKQGIRQVQRISRGYYCFQVDTVRARA